MRPAPIQTARIFREKELPSDALAQGRSVSGRKDGAEEGKAQNSAVNMTADRKIGTGGKAVEAIRIVHGKHAWGVRGQVGRGICLRRFPRKAAENETRAVPFKRIRGIFENDRTVLAQGFKVGGIFRRSDSAQLVIALGKQDGALLGKGGNERKKGRWIRRGLMHIPGKKDHVGSLLAQGADEAAVFGAEGAVVQIGDNGDPQSPQSVGKAVDRHRMRGNAKAGAAKFDEYEDRKPKRKQSSDPILHPVHLSFPGEYGRFFFFFIISLKHFCVNPPKPLYFCFVFVYNKLYILFYHLRRTSDPMIVDILTERLAFLGGGSYLALAYYAVAAAVVLTLRRLAHARAAKKNGQEGFSLSLTLREDAPSAVWNLLLFLVTGILGAPLRADERTGDKTKDRKRFFAALRTELLGYGISTLAYSLLILSDAAVLQHLALFAAALSVAHLSLLIVMLLPLPCSDMETLVLQPDFGPKGTAFRSGGTYPFFLFTVFALLLSVITVSVGGRLCSLSALITSLPLYFIGG